MPACIPRPPRPPNYMTLHRCHACHHILTITSPHQLYTPPSHCPRCQHPMAACAQAHNLTSHCVTALLRVFWSCWACGYDGNRAEWEVCHGVPEGSQNVYCFWPSEEGGNQWWVRIVGLGILGEDVAEEVRSWVYMYHM
ncbi:hypothetical protein EX30DRAFT_342683 [Ascodesmis nigricans]|uniref:Uncharacterized protein n=1 Tax=Ascodesmis nigricans TaxID=341454 RepID=A0A4S2MPM2_9PEZI|nr:hypothetical protein EX30DRAFT_342683 [Ascodesmis nigricans]